jgi:hypothetical protein
VDAAGWAPVEAAQISGIGAVSGETSTMEVLIGGNEGLLCEEVREMMVFGLSLGMGLLEGQQWGCSEEILGILLPPNLCIPVLNLNGGTVPRVGL